jgi:hypothetical protein
LLPNTGRKRWAGGLMSTMDHHPERASETAVRSSNRDHDPKKDYVTKGSLFSRARSEDEANAATGGLLGAIFTDSSLDAAGKQSRIDEVLGLRSTAIGEAEVPLTQAPEATKAPPAPGKEAQDLAWAQLEAMDRAAEIPNLDNAAKALAGVTTLLTGLFTGVGFTNGDFERMFRDFRLQSILFVSLASAAIILGAFAFAVNAYRSRKNLIYERAAVYVGIACAATAFGFAAWGLSQGASAGSTRPAISASFTTVSDSPALSVSVTSSAVPRTDHLNTTVWGLKAKGWTVLSNLVNGPAPDGTDNVNVTVSNVTAYTKVEVQASLSAKDVPPPPAPKNCSRGVSCFTLAGFSVPSPSPKPTP